VFAIDPSKPGDVNPITGDFTGSAAKASLF
jgi:hypothetical protein